MPCTFCRRWQRTQLFKHGPRVGRKGNLDTHELTPFREGVTVDEPFGTWIKGWALWEQMAHGLAPLGRCMFDQKWMNGLFERELWREDPMALDAIKHDFWEEL